MSSRIKRDNFVTILGWMITELGLKGNELIIYAIVYGFSQTQDAKFSGSMQYLADWCNSTKRGVIKSTKSLVDKGYILKETVVINNIKFVELRCVELSSIVVNKVHQGSEQSSSGVVNKVHQGSEQSSPNIYRDNIVNNIDINNKDIYIQKHKYGEFKNVLLSDKELDQLKEYISSKYEINDSQRFVEECITCLDEYIEIKAPKYKSHYLVIKKWVADEVKKKFVDTVSSDFDLERAVQDDDFFS